MRATTDFQTQIPPPSSFDVVICILWSRLGRRLNNKHLRPDGTLYESGTEYEFEDAARASLQTGKPELLIYWNQKQVEIPAKPIELRRSKLEQFDRLQAFLEKWFYASDKTIQAAYNKYAGLAEFEGLFETHLRSTIDRWAPATSDLGMAPVKASWTTGSPFRGLQSFEFRHAPVFFGRTRPVGDILQALRRQAEGGHPFIIITGMSGSGKTSLAKAGVLPLLLRPGVIEGIGLWRWAYVRPSDQGGDLWRGLAEAVVRTEALPEVINGTTTSELALLLKGTSGEAIGLLRGALLQASAVLAAREKLTKIPEARMALLVDQMEELFTHPAITAGTRKAFVQLLSAIAATGRVWVLATLRSDFFHRCEEVPELIDLKGGEGIYQLGPANSAEIGQLIRLPALAAGLHFEYDNVTGERLDDLLRDAALRDPGALPLLEFALDELFQRRAEQLLTITAYREMGGIEGALQKRAEDEFGLLSPAGQQSFESVFAELVQLHADAEDLPVRRRALQSRLHATSGGRELTDAFIGARLFVADNGPAGPEVAVAHEALLRAWIRLANWIVQNREFFAVRARINTAARRWLKEKRANDFLLPEGKLLVEARDLWENHQNFLSLDESEFVRASTNYATKRRQLRNRAIFISAGTIAAALVLGTAASTWEAIRAKRAERTVVMERTRAEDLLTFMLGDLRTQLAKVGRLDVLESVGDKAMAYFASLDPQHLTDASLARHSKALVQIGQIRMDQNRSLEAAEAFSEAYQRAAVLVTRHPTDGDMLFERGQAEYWNGFVHWNRGEFDAAAEWMTRYRDTSAALLALDPARPAWQSEYAYGQHNLAALSEERGKLAAAASDFKVELATLGRLIASDPGNADLQARVADAHSWLGDIAERTGDLAEATKQYQLQAIQYKHLAEAEPGTAARRYELANALLYQSRIATVTGRLAAAKGLLLRAQEMLVSLVAYDGTNLHWRLALLSSRLKAAMLSRQRGDLAAAGHLVDETLPQLETLAAKEPSDRSLSLWLATAWRIRAQLQSGANQGDAAASAMHAVGIGERLLGEGRAIDVDRGECATAYIVSGEVAAQSADALKSRRDLTRASEVLAPRLRGSGDWHLLDPAARAALLLGRSDEARAEIAQLTLFGYVPLDPWPALDHEADAKSSNTKPK